MNWSLRLFYTITSHIVHSFQHKVSTFSKNVHTSNINYISKFSKKVEFGKDGHKTYISHNPIRDRQINLLLKTQYILSHLITPHHHST